MLQKYIIAVTFSLLIIQPVSAEETIEFISTELKPTIVELYISQGCSSCPPAQNWLNNKVNDPNLWKTLFPIVFHVDYWDYLGWKDPFSKLNFSERQRNFRKVGLTQSVYTPGFMVNGLEWRAWFNREGLPAFNDSAPRLKTSLKGNEVTVTFEGQLDSELVYNAALLGFDIDTNVKRGENGGRVLKENFTVLEHVTKISNKNSEQLFLKTNGYQNIHRKAVVFWLTEKNKFDPLQATGGWL